ncbi:hypothetical protein LguiA_022071 [Lonicera macranthoides]
MAFTNCKHTFGQSRETSSREQPSPHLNPKFSYRVNGTIVPFMKKKIVVRFDKCN